MSPHPAGRIIVYQKPTCTACRQVAAALKAAGVDFDAVDYHLDPIPRRTLADLVRKIGRPARDLLRTKEPAYEALGLASRDLSEAELLDIMAEHPELIQRPIVERGDRAILARPAERLREIL
ncbi:MAG: arsenate reductase family protein [Vicinamibacterales bacterium]